MAVINKINTRGSFSTTPLGLGELAYDRIGDKSVYIGDGSKNVKFINEDKVNKNISEAIKDINFEDGIHYVDVTDDGLTFKPNDNTDGSVTFTKSGGVRLSVVTANAIDNSQVYLNSDEHIVYKDKDGVDRKLSNNEKYVDTIEDMFNIDLPKTNDVCVVRANGVGGTFIYDNNIDKTIDDGGVVRKGWVRHFDGNVNPDMFGAVGDGIVDDSSAVENAFNSGYNVVHKNIEKTYLCTRLLLIKPKNKSLSISGVANYIFKTSVGQIDLGFHIHPYINMDHISIRDLNIDGTNTTSRALYVDILDAYFLKKLDIKRNNVKNLTNIDKLTSVIGISVHGKNIDTVNVEKNKIENINRVLTNASSLACVGITCYLKNSNVRINNNDIKNITSPSGTADADGIHLFTIDSFSLGNACNNIRGHIYGNNIKNSKGRFIKLQTSNTKVYNNIFEIDGCEIIPNAIAIDAQRGGVEAYNNTLITKNTTVEGYTFVALGTTIDTQINSKEEYSYVHDNIWYSDKYNGGTLGVINFKSVDNATINFKNNIVKRIDNNETDTSVLGNAFYISFPDDNSSHILKHLSIEFDNNEVPIKSNGVLIGWDNSNVEQFKNIDITNKWSLSVINNKNTNIGASGTEKIAWTMNSFYGTNILYRDNVGVNDNRVAMNNMDALKLPIGTKFNFHYGDDNDWYVRTMSNVPTGYQSVCNVDEVSANKIILTKIDGLERAIYDRHSGTWSTETLIPGDLPDTPGDVGTWWLNDGVLTKVTG